jgi:hypothetical protein
MFIAAVPTGTTANITYNFGSTSVVDNICIWAMYGASGTVHDVATDTSDTFDAVTFDVPAGGVAFGFVSGTNSPPSNNAAWANLTEDVDIGANESGVYGASANFSGAQTSLAVQCDITTVPQQPIALFASFGE